MRKIHNLSIDDVIPTVQEVLVQQNMTGRAPSPRVLQLLDQALGIFRELANPMGVLEDFPAGEFPELYHGNGMNAPDGPVPSVVAGADAVAVMAATMGDALAVKSGQLFAEGSAALGYMMDAVNSSGAERLGRRMCDLFFDELPSEIRVWENLRVQYYCPGHCGWHISGQDKLFATLHPEDIGMSVNTRWVMFPFKSISGVVVAADIEVHRFQCGFSFCPQCRERKCVERFKLLTLGR